MHRENVLAIDGLESCYGVWQWKVLYNKRLLWTGRGRDAYLAGTLVHAKADC